MSYFDTIPSNELNIEAFETLFKSLARKGMFDDFQRFWSNLKQSAIEPSLKCYAAAFQCLGHDEISRENEDVKLFADILHSELEEMFEKNNNIYFEFDTLVENYVPRTKTDFEHLVKGIQLTIPNYSPKYRSCKKAEKIYGQNSLLKDLYQFPVSQLQPPINNYETEELLNRQYQAEIDGFVDVKSIAQVQIDQNDMDKALKCCEDLMEIWEKQLSEHLQEKLENRLLNWPMKFSTKENQCSMLPSSTFIDVIPIGKSPIEYNVCVRIIKA